ncbi:MAG TPA: DUF3108 domain-containing protein, partial [Pyrinomonadaceae bacterium]
AQQDGGAGTLSFSQSPYQIGERLTYNVSFSNIPTAAHAEFHIVSRGVYFGRDAIQLRAHVETVGVVNVALLALNNDYTTYIDPLTGLPFRSEETVRDATRSADSARDFNQPAGTEAIPPKERGFPGTYDLISAFYRARALPLTIGATYDFTVRDQGTEYEAELRVVGQDSINTNVGSFNAIVAEVRISGNSPLRKLKVYFSDDERHVPVLATARVSGGDLRAELAGSEIVKPPAPATPTPTPVIPAPMPTPSAPATVPPAVSGNENWPFTVGEQLNYQIFIGPNTTPAGIATFQVRGRSQYFDREGLYFTVNAQTTNALAQVFVARDQIDSYVEPKTLLPFRTVMKLIEGRRRLNQTLALNQDTGTAVIDAGLKIDVPVGTHDYLSFFYALRTLNLTLNKRSAVSMLVENKPMTVFVTSQKREAIRLGERTVPAIALSITTDDPEPDKYQLRMWISDDKRRLPLRIACATQLGPLRADLAILPAAPQ